MGAQDLWMFWPLLGGGRRGMLSIAMMLQFLQVSDVVIVEFIPFLVNFHATLLQTIAYPPNKFLNVVKKRPRHLQRSKMPTLSMPPKQHQVRIYLSRPRLRQHCHVIRVL